MEHDDAGFVKPASSASDQGREGRHLRTLRGPGIVGLRGEGPDGLVLDEAACSLADVLRERGPRPDSEVRAVGAAAAAALARVHDAGLVHGDVKPANLLLSPDGELWLADFDTAAAADGRPLAGFSPGRLAPGAPAWPDADMVALALTLVELSTGTLLDPAASWRTSDLRRLGCSPALSAEISFMLGRDGSALDAAGAADMFERGGGTLPAAAAEMRRADSTPTVEFMPAQAPPSQPAPGIEDAAPPRPPRWWQQLAAPSQPRRGPASAQAAQGQPSGSSQASRSS